MSCAIIILGSPNDEKGHLLTTAISRCEMALREYSKLSDCKILCTGGFGPNFNATDYPHGQYTQRYLEKQAVPASAFLDTALSAFTLEDAQLSKPILEKNAITHIVLVTSEFHMKRAKLVFNHVLPDIHFEYAEAKTDVTDVEFERLIEHEKKAIKRDRIKLQGKQ
jgi:uncharacterized SAM-binding protein YcdF (DUF218 family)